MLWCCAVQENTGAQTRGNVNVHGGVGVGDSPNNVAAGLDPVVQEGEASIGGEIGKTHCESGGFSEWLQKMWYGE